MSRNLPTRILKVLPETLRDWATLDPELQGQYSSQIQEFVFDQAARIAELEWALLGVLHHANKSNCECEAPKNCEERIRLIAAAAMPQGKGDAT